MTGTKLKLNLLLDASVPDSVGRAFEAAGHVVIHHRDVLPEKTADVVVCATAMANDAILVALDGDMKMIARDRFGASSTRFKYLNLIKLNCNEVLAAKRVAHVMSFIHHEWLVSDQKAARRLWIEIGPHHLRSNR